jgi:hypothetical protein
MTLNDIIDINLLDRFLTNLKNLFSTKSELTSLLDDKQDALESGTNIKTINNESILGSGNITIQGGGGGCDVNVIEGVKVNGTSLTPDSNKDVDIPQASASGFGVVRMSTDSVVNNQSELNDAGLTGIYGNALFVKAATTTQGGAITPAMVTKLNGLNAVTESTVSGWGFTKNTGTYSKPSSGIPASDLTDAVQTSLGKADTALQSFTESDPTVPSHVKGITTTDISNWNSKQAAIADLSDIRSGAALGATAVQTETDPVFNASAASGITSGNITSWNGKADKVAVVNHGTSDTTFTLTPNVLHIWGEVTSLNLTLGTEESGVINEFMFKFSCGSTVTTLTLPSSVEWVQELEPESGHTYEVSIVNGLAAYITDDMQAATQVQSDWNETNTTSPAYIRNKPDISSKADAVSITNHGTSDTTYTLTPNVFHVWGEVAALTLTLDTVSSTVLDEFMFQFESGSTPTVLTLPSTVKWISDDTIESGYTYQVSIVNNLAVMGGAES